MDAKKNVSSRRKFIAALGVGAAGAAAAAAAMRAGAPVDTAVARNDAKGKGYQETGHVRNYYKTTRV